MSITSSSRTNVGRVIVIAGPDGVGKSTLSEVLVNRLRQDHRVARFHQRASILPTRTKGPVTEPHRLGSYGAVLSLFKALYLFADSWLGWWVKVRPLVGAGGWVVIERGWWDIVVDPKRYRIQLPGGFLRHLAELLPQADLLVILEVGLEALAHRKMELPRDEFARQVRSWRAISARSKLVYLDGTRPIGELIGQVLDEARF
jgi:thymidylate kinase